MDFLFTAIYFSVSAETNYEKTEDGHPCISKDHEIKIASECKEAAKKLGLEWSVSYKGPYDFPACFYANDGSSVVFFNQSPYPGRRHFNPKYSAICVTSGKMLYRLN